MDSLWNEYFWLPEHISWDDLKSNATITYPKASDLKYTLVGGVLLLILRILFESFVLLPIGWIGGWIKTPLFSRMFQHLTGGFCGKSKFKRVAECAWRFSFYATIWVVGVQVLWNSPQLANVVSCWQDWPHHNVSDTIWWYYMVETSFYWALFFGTLCFDVRRADFMQMMAHHAITIALLGLSWSMNMIRVGTLILFSHDAADIFIELTKIVRYAGWDTTVSLLFVILLIVWIGTRLVYFPFWVLQSIWFDAPQLIQHSYKWSNLFQRPLVPRVLMVFLSLLLVLHIFWTYLLLRVAWLSTRSGTIDDVREDDSDSESDYEKKKKQ